MFKNQPTRPLIVSVSYNYFSTEGFRRGTKIEESLVRQDLGNKSVISGLLEDAYIEGDYEILVVKVVPKNKFYCRVQWALIF